MTLLILIASEIIPKTIGATYWRRLTNFTAIALKGMVLVLKYTGILWVLQLFTRLISHKGPHVSILSREDFTTMADIARDEGVFQESESQVIKNLLKLNEVLIKDIMTPRAVMQIAPEQQSIAAFYSENQQSRFSRIPVYGEQEDNITGYVLKDNVLEEIIHNNGHIPLSDIKRDILVTKRVTPIPQLFEIFIAKREHLALVVYEYGSVSGLVSMEDVIETLLGLEIMDESDTIADLQLLARKNWEDRAKRTGVIE
jgi:CBS domain containing-hemolysin-like protein